ncbi:uncharacterized protein LOC116655916 [Drosophila ananassae]|uniref:uncharacterized protein LOC116655916 n=1 Tax=Drosophila ananassae TaxID=7217 RepID=UPI0013A5D851|nr:uncharacterized protein LOC116655916 [Drosophila ananassae]
MPLAWPNRKHSPAGRKSCSLTSLVAPVAMLLPLLLWKSTEPPDERRGLPMSRRRIPGLGRRGGPVVAVVVAVAVAVAAGGTESGLASPGAPDGSALSLPTKYAIHCAHTSAVQRQREQTIPVSWPQYPYVLEATITRAATGTENKM